nr:J domain-containing protein [Spirochaeta sp.]
VIDDVALRLSDDTEVRFLEELASIGSVTVARVPTAEASVQAVIDATAQVLGVNPATVGNRCARQRPLDEDACRLLGVGPDVKPEELKHTYRQLASQMHPDTGVALEGYQQDELADAFVRIRDAYERLLGQIEVRDRRRT